MKKYLSYIMMLIKSTWKIFVVFFLIVFSWQFISFFIMLGNNEPFEDILNYTGRLYTIVILGIFFLLYFYRKHTERKKFGMILPIEGKEILASRVLYGLGWFFIITSVTIITIYVEGRIYIASMPSDLVSGQTIVMGLLNSDFGNIIYKNPPVVILTYIVLFVSFTILVSLDTTVTKELSNKKIICIYLLLLVAIILASVSYIRELKSFYIINIPGLLIIILLFNGDVLSDLIFGQKDR